MIKRGKRSVVNLYKGTRVKSWILQMLLVEYTFDITSGYVVQWKILKDKKYDS